ncbi:sensor histidine kinase [Duganella callida]|uniref:histidine kinase n=1 Tax=Duganella callida TaxID=2561932 RepID=A0A4Y9SXP8_9BURK|nr:PAS domain-containing sensor histidine kinase [Duganella callida]TFW31215.1 PAS domain-containing sensor histidine kinase [Duganella callida]
MFRVPRTPCISALLVVLMLLIFAIDTFSPLDMAIAVMYVVVVLLSASVWERRGVLLAAGVCLALTLLSYLLTHTEIFNGAPFSPAAVGRLLVGLLAIVITSFLVLRGQAATNALIAREEALRRSEAFLAGTQRISKTGSFSFKAPGGAMFWSDEAARIYGYPIDVDPTMERILAHTAPEDRHLVQAAIEQSLRCEDEIELRHRLLLPDGELKYVHVLSKPRHNRDGECEYLGALTDVTAAVLAEQALHRSQVQLQHATRVTMLGELAASIAHEVNQPLAAIATNGEACLRWMNRPQPDLDEARASVSAILEASARATGVIKRIRALARRSEPQHLPLDLPALVEESVDLVRRELNNHHVALMLGMEPALPEVLGDRVQLQQVIINLLMNAMQAMAACPPGQAVLTVQAQRLADGTVQVSVSDSGPGIPAAVAPRLFEPFYSTKEDGMGMGLPICRSIIETHGGRIWVKQSAPDSPVAGATILFSLPVHDAN